MATPLQINSYGKESHLHSETSNGDTTTKGMKDASSSLPPPPAVEATNGHDNSAPTNIPETSVTCPNPATTQRLLNKFLSKSQPNVPPRPSSSFLSFFSSAPPIIPNSGDPSLEAYASLQTTLSSTPPSDPLTSLTAFIHLLSTWAHRSSNTSLPPTTSESKTAFIITPTLLSLAIDTAQQLVAHGCLDAVHISLNPTSPPLLAINILTESIFVCDLSAEGSELSALKFLLTTGCRTFGNDEAMLRGTHLLQTIRVCYHVYLKTGSEPNRTTARAALQQLVSSVFKRMEVAVERGGVEELEDADDGDVFGTGLVGTGAVYTKVLESLGFEMEGIKVEEGSKTDAFPSPDHRDAFLVFRSLCKLSMKSLPGSGENLGGARRGSHGYGASGGGAAWDAAGGGGVVVEESIGGGVPHHNPALESKILALELLLYVLDTSSPPALLSAGPQFQFAIRHYLCVSLLNNCTSHLPGVVGLSLRLFLPLIRHLSSNLKTEIEAFVTNVFFVILDSSNSTLEHKTLVVTLFEQICSDPDTLAEIFLNYDCDMSAVDLFDRIINTLAKMARVDHVGNHSGFLTGGVRLANMRQEQRELRLEAMRALRHVLESLHASVTIVERVEDGERDAAEPVNPEVNNAGENVNLVEIYDSKKRRREEEMEVVLRFNQKPSAGIAYAAKCGHIIADDPKSVAKFLLLNKERFDKTQIGEYLGREPNYQEGFALRVLHAYVDQLDFKETQFDEAIRHYLSGFRLPGEAQKIDRIMEKFAERYCLQNPDVFPTADVAFILAFSIIMLNTDLHNPAIKEEKKMTIEGFIRNNRGICDGADLPHDLLRSIFDRIKQFPISLKEDDDAREAMEATDEGFSLFSTPNYDEIAEEKERNFQKERETMLRTTESLLRRRTKGRSSRPSPAFVKIATGLRDEYVTPMFEVTWGPALAVFSTAIESANGTATPSALAAMVTDEEVELAIENATEAIEVCLMGFRLAILTAGLCGNDVARRAFVNALFNFTQLGIGRLMNYRHVRCLQALLKIGRDDGELLGDTWEYVFKALSEMARLRQVYELMQRNDRMVPPAAPNTMPSSPAHISDDDDNHSINSDVTDYSFLHEDEMDHRSIDEINARAIAAAIPDSIIEDIYHRSMSLSSPAAREFVLQLCRVSRMEIAGYGGHVGSRANFVDMSERNFREQHTLLRVETLESSTHHNQPVIYSLQKLVEVTHYNMDSRPRLVFAEMWTNVAGHLTSTALHSNAAVAMYAVDSFRQLSIQFLTREELGMFEFQRRFLKPLETIMARSEYESTKELLLKCIEQIILMFGIDVHGTPGSDVAERKRHSKRKSNKSRGTLRSGWRPLLAVLGLAGHDSNDEIAATGFKMIDSQVKQSLNSTGPTQQKSFQSNLITEHFVDLVDALVLHVTGRWEERSLMAVDHLVELSRWLADGAIPLPTMNRRTSYNTMIHFGTGGEDVMEERGSKKGRHKELELWWPILLGLSRSVGDARWNVREKSLNTLLDIINTYFFPKKGDSTSVYDEEDEKDNDEDKNGDNEDNEDDDDNDSQKDVQILQLIFRGILTSILENAETDDNTVVTLPSLPDNFAHFVTHPPPPSASKGNDPIEDVIVNDDDLAQSDSWLETTFDPLMDHCISLCIRSMSVYKSDLLVEEVLAMINSCLLSDSGALAVRGLRRLEKFINNDLQRDDITEETWAVVCHMLSRCLTVRCLSSVSAAVNRVAQNNCHDWEEDMALINDFVMEEEFMAQRRYIGPNATMIIGMLVDSDDEILGTHWLLFLIEGLARAIGDWEEGAAVLGAYGKSNGENTSVVKAGPSPPHYLENALYGRKLMVKLILLLAHKIERRDIFTNDEITSAQQLLQNQTQSIISSFLFKENLLNDENEDTEKVISEECRAGEVGHLTTLVCDLLEGYNSFDDTSLFGMSWLCPMLSELIRSNNRAVRVIVHDLVSRIFRGPMITERMK